MLKACNAQAILRQFSLQSMNALNQVIDALNKGKASWRLFTLSVFAFECISSLVFRSFVDDFIFLSSTSVIFPWSDLLLIPFITTAGTVLCLDRWPRFGVLIDILSAYWLFPIGLSTVKDEVDIRMAVHFEYDTAYDTSD